VKRDIAIAALEAAFVQEITKIYFVLVASCTHGETASDAFRNGFSIAVKSYEAARAVIERELPE
jgi:hypothetical protein